MRGELAPTTAIETLPYAGAALAVPGVEFSVCSVCGEEVVLDAQAKRNDVRFADAKRAHDGLLTSDAIFAWRHSLGLSQREAAEMLGGGANAFSKYERGEVIQSKPMDLLMRVAEQMPEARSFLAERAGVNLVQAIWNDFLGDDGEEFSVIKKAVPAKKGERGAATLFAWDIDHQCEVANDHTWHDAGDFADARRIQYG